MHLVIIRSIIDHASHISSFASFKDAERLTNMQNEKKMRVMLCCFMSTRLGNVRTKLRLPPVQDRGEMVLTDYAKKILQNEV